MKNKIFIFIMTICMFATICPTKVQAYSNEMAEQTETGSIKKQNVVKAETNAITPRNVGTQFVSESVNGSKLRFTVLTEDSATKTGTVEIGSNKVGPGTGTYNGNGAEERLDDVDLVLPETVTYNGYTYTLTKLATSSLRQLGIKSIVIPNTVEELGPSCLTDNKLTEIRIPEGVTFIDSFALANSSLEVAYLPSTITKLGTSIFGNDTPKLRNVYFPITNVITIDSASIGKNAPIYGLGTDGSHGKTAIICENEEQYTKAKTMTTIFDDISIYNLTYEMEMKFYDKDGNPLQIDKPVYKLYAFPVSWEKNSQGTYENKWVSTSNHGIINDLPKLPDESDLGYKANYWGQDALGIVTVNKDGKIEVSSTQGAGTQASIACLYVMSKEMYAVEEQFEITLNPSVPHEYNGLYELGTGFNRNSDIVKSYFAKNKATVTFAYWIFDKKDLNKYIYYTFSKNSIQPGIRNVADSGDYAIWYTLMDTRVTKAFYLWSTPQYNTAKAIQYNLSITPAEIDYDFKVGDIAWNNQTTLPDITLSRKLNNIDGKIVWDTNQVPQLGTHSYSYTLIPTDLEGVRLVDDVNVIKADNYKTTSKTGTVEITYIQYYDVSFVGFNQADLGKVTVEDGKDATAPTPPEVAGYHFVGWDKDFTNVTGNLTVTAIYEKNPIINYEVTFVGFNQADLGKVTVEEGKDAIAPTPPEVEGYHFVKWDKDFTNVTGNLTVTAIYEKNPITNYEVTFVGFNQVNLGKVTVIKGQDAIAPTPPEVAGYHFVKWDKDFTNVTENLTVTAIYEKNPITNYEVSFVGFNQANLGKVTVEEGKDAVAPTPPEVVGYKFARWDKAFTNVTENLTITAIYEEVQIDQPVINNNTENNASENKTSGYIISGRNGFIRNYLTNGEDNSSIADTEDKKETNVDKKKYIIENKNDGIKVESLNKSNIFNSNAEVVVEEGTKSEKEHAEQKLDNVIRVIDVVIKEDGVKIETTLDSKVKIYLNVKDYKDYENLKVWQKTKKGEYKELTFTIENEQIIFECDTLDTYVLTGNKVEKQDADYSFIWWIIAATGVGTGFIILIYKKKKEDEEEE